jgi:low temperature requirement protein LtrA
MSDQHTEHEHRVTPLELFFDLVFVFAFTQVTTLMSDDTTWGGLGDGLLILAALWWAWAGYAWLTNAVDPDEGVVRGAMLVAITAMFVAALVVPDAFGAHGVLFGVAFLIVRLMHVALFALAGRGDRDLLSAVLRITPSTVVGAGLIIAAGDEPKRRLERAVDEPAFASVFAQCAMNASRSRGGNAAIAAASRSRWCS